MHGAFYVCKTPNAGVNRAGTEGAADPFAAPNAAWPNPAGLAAIPGPLKGALWDHLVRVHKVWAAPPATQCLEMHIASPQATTHGDYQDYVMVSFSAVDDSACPHYVDVAVSKIRVSKL